MKKITTTLIVLLYLHLLWAQNAKTIQMEANKKLLSTKYAVILYAQQVTDTSGSNKLIASHWQNNGGGTSERPTRVYIQGVWRQPMVVSRRKHVG